MSCSPIFFAAIGKKDSSTTSQITYHKFINQINSNIKRILCKCINLSFKRYLKYSIFRGIGELLFYLGFAVAAVGIAFLLIAPFLLFSIMGIVGIVLGGVMSVSGYLTHKYGKFKENTEQIASGVSQGIQTVSISQKVLGAPPNPCPDCGHELTFIEQHKTWYCFNCKKYK